MALRELEALWLEIRITGQILVTATHINLWKIYPTILATVTRSQAYRWTDARTWPIKSCKDLQYKMLPKPVQCFYSYDKAGKNILFIWKSLRFTAKYIGYKIRVSFFSETFAFNIFLPDKCIQNYMHFAFEMHAETHVDPFFSSEFSPNWSFPTTWSEGILYRIM